MEFQVVPEDGGPAADYETSAVEEVRLGRDADAMREGGDSGRVALYKIPPQHRGVSGYHARIYYEPRRRVFLLEGLGQNGTFLNDVRIANSAPKELRSGNRIRLGPDGPTVRFNEGRPAREPAARPESARATRPEPVGATRPEPAGPTRPEGMPAPVRQGYVRCPQCGDPVLKSEARQHPHPIDLEPSGEMPRPAQGALGTTVELIRALGRGSYGTKTVEFVKGALDKIVQRRISAKMRAVYAALGVVAVVSGFLFYRERTLRSAMERKLMSAEQNASRAQEDLKRLKKQVGTVSGRGGVIQLTDALNAGVYRIYAGIGPEGSSDPKDVVREAGMGTAFAVKPGVLVTNAHVAFGLKDDTALQGTGLKTLTGFAVQGGSKEKCYFKPDAFKIPESYEKRHAPQSQCRAANPDWRKELANLKALIHPAAPEELKRQACSSADLPACESAWRGRLDELKPCDEYGTEDFYDDVAALRLDCGKSAPLKSAPAAELQERSLPNGSRVALVGYPGVLERHVTSTKATVSNGYLAKRDQNLLIIDALASGGSSGSPVIKSDQKLVGVFAGCLYGDDGSCRFGVGVPLPTLQQHIKDWGF